MGYLRSISLLFVCAFVAFFSAASAARSITCVDNPGCNTPDCDEKKTHVAHIVSQEDGQTNHFLWGFIDGFVPSLFLFETDNSAQLTIDWKKLTSKDNSGAISFGNGTVRKAYGLELSNVDFRDGNNTHFYTLPVDSLNWVMKKDCTNNAMFNFDSINGTANVNGTIGFDLNVYKSGGRFDKTPHLAFTSSSSIFNIRFDNIFSKKFPTDMKPDNAVFPFADITIAFEGEHLKGVLSQSKSINDEYSPGVFERHVYEIDRNGNSSAFTEWRPVAYNDNDRVVAKSVKVIKPTVEDSKLTEKSLLNAYFGSKKAQVQTLKDFQFGSADDSFDYRSSGLIAFTMGSGFGQIQPDSLSGTVKIVLFVGLGVPAALVLVSAIYTVYLKCGSREQDFETLEN